MSKGADDRIILCQPDNIKGCSLCCGLFNFRDISSGFLSSFLEKGRERESSLATYAEHGNPDEIRDISSHICPYQGFLKENNPGCLIHPISSGYEGRGRSLFESKICSEFYCPAHAILSEEEKLFLVEKVQNWYLYSVAVADPESYSFIYSYIKENFSDDSDSGLSGMLVNKGLFAHAANLALYDGVIFCYSIPEYNINKRNFSLKYITKKRDLVVSLLNEYASGVAASN